MPTIKQIMEQIPRSEKDRLMAAFEAGMTDYIEWTPGRYLGVNTTSVPHLKADQESGSFQEGIING